jgi:hypothetical protein
MSALKLQTLKHKLWAIVATSFVARVVMFFTLPNTPSSLAPDEGTYAKLAKWIAESKPVSDFPEFGGGLYLSSKAVVLPASSFVKLGINELDAVRLSSSIYGFACLVLIVVFAIIRFKAENETPHLKSYHERLVLIIVLVFAFLPSHFLWSTLGLREAANEFWLIVTLTFVFLSLTTFDALRWIYFTALSLSLVLVYSSRPQVGWLLTATLIVFSLITFKGRGHLILVIFVAIGSVGGYFTTNPLVSDKELTFNAVKLVPNQSSEMTSDEMTSDEMTSDEKVAAKKCVTDNQTVSINDENFLCIATERERIAAPQEQIKSILPKALEQVEVIPEKHLANKVSAASEIDSPSCPIEESHIISKGFCLMWRVPSASITFLFRPFPYLDTTSTLSNFASAENLLWLAGVGFLVFQFILKRRARFAEHIFPSGLFLVLYVIGAGLYEGNMGTAFRHKSLILSMVLLLLLAVLWSNKGETIKPLGDNSQERAV